MTILKIENLVQVRGEAHKQNGFGKPYRLRLVKPLIIKGGQEVKVVGRSGTGKTTFLRIIAGLEWAKDASVSWDFPSLNKKYDVHCDMKTDELRKLRGKHVSFAFQHAPLLPWLTVEEAFQYRINRANPDIDQNKRGELLAMAVENLNRIRADGEEVHKLLRSYRSALSGGQKQRVALCLALASEPNVLIGDEIESQLDPKTQDDVRAMLGKWLENDEERLIIHSTHSEVVDDIENSQGILKVDHDESDIDHNGFKIIQSSNLTLNPSEGA